MGKLVVYIVLTVGAIIFIAPWLWMVSASFQPVGDMFNWPPTWIPEHFTFENYKNFLEARGLWRWIANSTFLSVSILLIQLVLNSMAAYAYAKRRFPGRDFFYVHAGHIDDTGTNLSDP